MTDNLVEIKNLTKTFPDEGTPAIDNITASIQKGKITGLVGPDGAGKTTLIRLITGLYLPTDGEIIVNADDIGYMPQKFGLYEDLSVQQNLDLYADLRGLEKSERKETFERLLKFTSLAPFIKRLAGKLSGGMKQKLGIACALISKPQLLLLDEPGVGVDPISRRELWAMVQELLKDEITVLWSTAYLDEAAQCEEVLLLNNGKMLFEGKPQDLTDRMQGRVFMVKDHADNQRRLLRQVLKHEGVIDGVIQGSSVRVLTSRDSDIKPNPKIIPAKPRFEDSFVDILGGGPGGESELANMISSIEKSDKPLIEARNLTKMYGDFAAAKNINFSVKSGEIFGLLGPNGAGKSTTFKMLCGLSRPTYGEAYVTGLNLETASGKARAKIGYMAQKFSLYDHLSVMQNLKFFSGVYGLNGKEQKERIDDIINIFQFKKYLNINSGGLPLGFKQRLALACAVMHEPEVLFLDEPTSGVDPITRREFWTHINNMVEKGVTIMVTTHFMDEAEYCDRISLIYKAESIAIGTPDELKNMAKTTENPDPTMEDAFIGLIEENEKINSFN